MLLAKEIMSSAEGNPKINPPAMVRIAAPGTDSPVMIIYVAKKIKVVIVGVF